MGTFFGIDIGRYSVKMVGLRSSLRGIEPLVSKEFVFPANTGFLSEENTEGLKEFFAIEGLSSSDVNVSVPSDIVSVHTLSVPFTEEKFISQSVGSELEEVSAYSLEEIVMDYNTVGKEDGRSSVITFAVNTDTMKQWIDALLRTGLDPNIIDVPHCAYANLAQYIKLDQPFAVIDIGHAHTSVSFMDNNGLFITRDIRINASMMGLTAGKESADEKMRSAFVRDLEQSISMVERKFGTTIGYLVFAGRFSDKAGLFEKDLGLQAFSLPLGDIVKAATDETMPLGPEYTLAFALALRHIVKKPRNPVNLRKGPFKFERAIEQVKGRLFTTLGIAGLVIVLFITSMAYGYINLNQKRDKLDNKMLQLFKSAFPDEPSMGDPLGSMRYLVSQEKKKAENLSGSVPVLEILREISAGMPKDVKVDVTELSVDPEQISLRGKTPTLDGVDKIVAGIKNSADIKDVKVIDTSKSADQKSFEFQLSITLK